MSDDFDDEMTGIAFNPTAEELDATFVGCRAVPRDLADAIRGWACQRPDLLMLARDKNYPGYSKEVALMRVADRLGVFDPAEAPPSPQPAEPEQGAGE